MIQHRAVTLFEVLVVLVVVVVAVGVGVMLLGRVRESAQQVQCRNNLRLIGKAFHAYHDASSPDEAARSLPPARLADGYATWAVFLAPYLMADHPLQHWDLQQAYFAQKQETREARMVMFFCPARTRSDTLSTAGDVDAANLLFPGGLGDYACVAGDGNELYLWTGPKANGALVIAEVVQRKGDRIVKWQSRTGLSSLKRGTSYTLLVGDKHVPDSHMGDAEFGDGSLYNGSNPASFSRVAGPGFPLTDDRDVPFNRNFGSYHHRVCQFLMADGSFKAMSVDTSELVLGQLARRGE
jgi:uncharacterized protein DUF1559